ncbi:class I SAM-dependent methyltransferase [Lapidilactobacillus bayanensis]|uniref:class I SAM-dependent methyltransferase n=1 Tax=Lapidilactobacillus bayanensis TaxID=2485998 RepID=UPI000F7B8C22|nr:class I SAM-dependent methyltransferase [Lapidilactobacillus bayanensis]
MTDLAEEKAAWNDFAATYYDTEQQSQLPYVADVLEFLQRINLLPAQILDLGSGAGRFSLPFAQAGVAVTAVDFSEKMLAILQRRVMQQKSIKPIRLITAAWQDLVKAKLRVPALWLSMLPDVDPTQMLTISRMATKTVFIFRLNQVDDPVMTPLFTKLNLPQERPEVHPDLMAAYQMILQSEFNESQTKYFNYQINEELSQTELTTYLQDYPEMALEKLTWLQHELQPELKNGRLKSRLNYQFELLILQR